mgnify:CR=1 FL=1
MSIASGQTLLTLTDETQGNVETACCITCISAEKKLVVANGSTVDLISSLVKYWKTPVVLTYLTGIESRLSLIIPRAAKPIMLMTPREMTMILEENITH